MVGHHQYLPLFLGRVDNDPHRLFCDLWDPLWHSGDRVIRDPPGPDGGADWDRPASDYRTQSAPSQPLDTNSSRASGPSTRTPRRRPSTDPSSSTPVEGPSRAGPSHSTGPSRAPRAVTDASGPLHPDLANLHLPYSISHHTPDGTLAFREVSLANVNRWNLPSDSINEVPNDLVSQMMELILGSWSFSLPGPSGPLMIRGGGDPVADAVVAGFFSRCCLYFFLACISVLYFDCIYTWVRSQCPLWLDMRSKLGICDRLKVYSSSASVHTSPEYRTWFIAVVWLIERPRRNALLSALKGWAQVGADDADETDEEIVIAPRTGEVREGSAPKDDIEDVAPHRRRDT
ncbi:hypothetical protein JCGZ_12686 [Jatropha curcas]|uniref:Uncharacterized protein n=1 Tax=Jatropha curcas TaxID=180498 RepID=A0A067KQ26_JATCU|nr:hypothetical protein JCGZ_12686 [Jatropha curcas]